MGVLKFHATRFVSNKRLEHSALSSLLWQGTQDFWVREFTEHFKDIHGDVCVHMVEHAHLKTAQSGCISSTGQERP